jgi:GT2 family glycosyltransferase
MVNEKQLPFVSIIVPVYNRAALIKDCLNSLMNLDYPKKKLEIIVVDDGSTDASIEVIKSFRNLAPNIITLLSSKRKGSASARKLGISHAKGEIIAFTDSDCRVDKYWLKELIKYFQNLKVGAVAGKTIYSGPKNYISKILERKSIQITYYYALHRKVTLEYAPTCNLAVKKEILKMTGEYGKDFFHGGDDIDLGVKIKNLGYKIALARKAVVYHERTAKKNILSIIKTLILYGKADFILQLKYPWKKQRVFPPPLFIFFYLVIMIPFLPRYYLLLPLKYLLIYILVDYSLIFLTRSRNLYEYTAGSAVNYNPLEYLSSFLIKATYDLGIFLKKISKFKLTPTYFIVDDRTLYNLRKSNKKEIFVNMLVFIIIFLTTKK